MTVLILGAGGQTAHYAAALYRARGGAVVTAGRSAGEVRLDVADGGRLARLVREVRPAAVLHLAARSTTRDEAALEHQATIVQGTANLLEAVGRHCPEARVFLAGSGLQFARGNGPIDEETPFAATSTYALARIQAVTAARFYRERGLRVYVGYLFHHESPRRKADHVSVQVVRGVRALAAGRAERLVVGSLAVAKEWTFAGDVAAAIATLLDQDRIREAVIGSGEAHTIGAWAAACCRLAGLDGTDGIGEVPGFRPEYPRLVSRPDRIRGLGWRPRVGFLELARMMMAEVP
jgi:GDPmannose 4,6-dehydratase